MVGKKSSKKPGKTTAPDSGCSDERGYHRVALGELGVMVGLLGVVYAVCSASFLYNAAVGRCMFLVRLFSFLLLEAGLGKSSSGITMPPVRAMAR